MPRVAEGGEMARETCSECGSEVSERAARARPNQSREIHPVTWIAAAALIPIFVWDVRQTVKEVRLHRASIEASRSLPLNHWPQALQGKAALLGSTIET